jgi:hypothetical protein
MNLLDKIVLGIVIFMALAMLLVGLMLFWPYKTITILNAPAPLVKSEVTAGGNAQIYVEYCKFVDSPAIIERALIDTVVIFYEPIINKLPPGCGKMTLSVKIPEYATSGEYFFRNSLTYQLNPIRKKTVVYDTQKFHITGLVDKLPDIIEQSPTPTP